MHHHASQRLRSVCAASQARKVSSLHLGWAAWLLLSIIHFWWWEFRLALVPRWTFAIYFFVILYAILFYSLCTLLFPSDLKDYSGYEDYFLSRRRWFFGILAATCVADIIDTTLKGSAYPHSFGVEYPMRIAAGLAVSNRRDSRGCLRNRR
jgi:hypothetical protein